MHLTQPGITYSSCGPFTINKGRNKSLKRQEIHDIFIKRNLIKILFNMKWVMAYL